LRHSSAQLPLIASGASNESDFKADIERARADPRAKQALLTRALEQLLAALSRLQHQPTQMDPETLRQLRAGAKMAAKVADLIRDLEEQTHLAESASEVA
jgi:hypothetical protein